MTVFCICLKSADAAKISDSLTLLGHAVQVCPTVESLKTAVSYSKDIPLVAADYRVFNGQESNPYNNFRREISQDALFLFYNDPMPSPDKRFQFWISTLELFFSPEKIEALKNDGREILLHIQECTKSLLAPNAATEEKPSLIEALKKECRLPPSRMVLLDFFARNNGTPVSVQTICRYLWNDDSPEKANRLYSYITQLRTALKKASGYNAQIIRTEKNTYIFTMENPTTEKIISARRFLSEKPVHSFSFTPKEPPVEEKKDGKEDEYLEIFTL
ncbi:MAG TPA: hypothetical protein DEO40_01210 [Treponema sp.]|jgi:DNA-binding winged helix-turn-helix (wHTH) protein|nr:hypothetical protein [Treponema sp.]HCA19280.1 hypothetical protein [Treponema sp.]